MKRWNWQIALGVSLLVCSAFFYLLHYLIFRDPHHIFIYLVGDVAFVFIEVLLVTLIIHRVLETREKRARLEKLNMVIGAFFSEVGTELLKILSKLDPKMEAERSELTVGKSWTERDFARVARRLNDFDYGVDPAMVDWGGLREFLVGKRDFLLRLLENPNLLEHEVFTSLLQAVFHLAEELGARRRLDGLPATDYRHLAGDIRRVYIQLVQQWLAYMKYLKGSYPYLFSLALRTHPFDKSASPVVRE
jgi:hypothetical protein